VREALTVIEMVMYHTYPAAFRDWNGAHPADVVGIRIAAADLQTHLFGLMSEGGGEGAGDVHTAYVQPLQDSRSPVCPAIYNVHLHHDLILAHPCQAMVHVWVSTVFFLACSGGQYHRACYRGKNKAPDTFPVVAPPQRLGAKCQ